MKYRPRKPFASSAKQRRSTKNRGSRRRISRFETLENRRVLATFFVNSTDDDDIGICVADDDAGSASCTIRSAIIEAEASLGSDVISIADGTYIINSDLGSFDVFDNSPVEFIGRSGNRDLVIIDGDVASRAFEIFGGSGPVTTTFRDLTIQNGLADDSSGGGAINAGPNADLVIDNVVLQNNLAADDAFGSGGPSSGGAISASGNVTIDDSLLDSNTATLDGGAIDFSPFTGGNRTLTIRNSTISGNQTGDSSVDGGIGRGFGGGVISRGEGLGEVNFLNVTVSGNSAGDSGGGVYLDGDSFISSGSTFVNNAAQGSDSGGGGVYIFGSGPTTPAFSVTGGTFMGNTSVAGGGGFEAFEVGGTIDGTRFSNNRSTGLGNTFDEGGGAIAIISLDGANISPVTIQNATIEINQAPAAGGLAVVDGNVTIINSLFDNNEATDVLTGGGGVGIVDTNIGTTAFSMSASTISNNRGPQGAGIGSIDADVSISQSTIAGNTANAGRAGGIGLIGIIRDPRLTIEESTVSNNSASGDGGGIGVADASFTLTNVTVSQNTSSGSGGGIASDNGTDVSSEIVYSTISFNSANAAGSNIAALNGRIDIEGSIFADGAGAGAPGSFLSLGGNLDSGNSMGFSGPGDLINTDPLLGPLTDNGGPVFTRALGAGSPAIDAGTEFLLATDARGVPRPIDGNGDSIALNDIGAFEGEDLSPLVELLLGARDGDDDSDLDADGDRVINVSVGEVFDLELGYLDLRSGPAQLGVAKYVSDIMLSTQGALVPAVTSTQFLNFGPNLEFATGSEIVLSLAGNPAEATIPFADFQANPSSEIIDALVSLGYSPDQLEPIGTAGGSGEDFVVGIHFRGDDLVLVNQPQIVSEVRSSPVTVTTSTRVIDPLLPGGEINPDAVPFVITNLSRTNPPEATDQPFIGSFDPTFGLRNVGAFARGLTIADPTTQQDAFSVPVIVRSPVQSLVVSLVPSANASNGGLGSGPDGPINNMQTADVNGDNRVTLIDVIQVINALEFGGEESQPSRFDVNRDGIVAPVDALIIINQIQRAQFLGTETANLFATDDGDFVLKNDDGPIDQARILTDSDAVLTINAMAAVTSTLTINDVRVREGNVAVVTVGLDNGTVTPFTVDVATSDGTAIAGEDYTAMTQTLSFEGFSGETQTFLVPLTDDALTELAETFLVGLSDVVGATVTATDTATVRISDNDSSRLSFEAGTINSVGEGSGTLSVTVSLAGATEAPFTVDVMTAMASVAAAASGEMAGGTAATPGVDYQSNSQTLSFAGNDGETQTFVVTINEDSDVEGDELFLILLRNIEAGGRDVNVDATQGVANFVASDVDSFTPAAGNPSTVAIENDFVYTGQASGVSIYDVAFGRTQTLLATLNDISINANDDLEIVGNLLFTPSAIIDVADRINPVKVTSFGLSTTPSRIDVGSPYPGLFASIISDDVGFEIVDVTNSSSPVSLGTFDVAGSPTDVDVDGNRAYVTVADSGLIVLDITDPANISQIGFFGTTGLASGVDVKGTTAFIADGDSIIALDVADPASIQQIGSLIVPNGSATTIEVEDDVAYITRGGLSIVDVSDPTNMRIIGERVSTAAIAVDGPQFVESTGQEGDATVPLNVVRTTLDATQTVTILDNDFNTPTAIDDVFTVLEDSTTNLDFLANDFFVGPADTIASVSSPQSGTVTIASDGRSVDYTPNADFFGTDSFTYTLDNGAGSISTANVTINVSGVNDPPVAVADFVSAAFETTLVIPATTLLSNDTAGPANETDTLVITAVNPIGGGFGGSGTAGTVSLDVATGEVTYVPASGFSGTDSFNYTLSDGLASAVGTVTVNVGASTDADLTVAKSVSSASALAGDTLVYTINVANNGPAIANSVFITDTLPAGVTFVSGTGISGEALMVFGGVVTASVGDIDPQADATITINVTINANVGSTITNTASVSTITNETDLTNNTDTVDTLVDPMTSSIAGRVYVDANFNGIFDLGETGIGGVAVQLIGTDDLGNSVDVMSITDSSGNYLFSALAAGSYQVFETQPFDFGDGSESVGSGAIASSVGDDSFDITIGPGANAVDFNFGETELVVTATISTGADDGDLTVEVDTFGNFGTFSRAGQATFDPIGPTNAASTVFESSLAIRESATGPRTFLDDIPFGSQNGTITSRTPTTVISLFTIGSFEVELTQTARPNFAINGVRNGAVLEQSYRFTNNAATATALDIVRYVDGDLDFDGSLIDGGGTLTDANGNLILFETDSGGNGSSDVTFFGITDGGDGLAPATDRFMLQEFSSLRTLIEEGTPLGNQINGDLDGDNFIDVGQEYDVTLALRRLLNVAPGESATYITNTTYGSRPDSIVAPPPTGITGHVSCETDQGIEEVVGGALVFLDRNGNRELDLGEPSTLTDAMGDYSFPASPDAGSFVVVQIPRSCLTLPTNPGVIRSIIDVGVLSRSIDTFDFDNDGDRDLLITGEIDNSLTVLINEMGEFRSGPRIQLADRPQHVDVFEPTSPPSGGGGGGIGGIGGVIDNGFALAAAVNAMVGPQIAVAAFGTTADGGSLFRGNSVSSMEAIDVGDGPVEVVVDDFDGNGIADHAIASLRSSDIRVLMNGSSTSTQIATTRQARTVTSGDVNGDGNIDIIAGGFGYERETTSELIVMLGDGAGGFEMPIRQILPKGLVAVEVADSRRLRLDGADARIFALSESGFFSVYDVRADGSLVEIARRSITPGANSFALGYFDDNDLIDVAVGNLGDQTIELFVGNGEGSFASLTTVRNVIAPSSMVVDDFNGDSIDDIAVANLYQDANLSGIGPPELRTPSTATVLRLDLAESARVVGANAGTIDFTFTTSEPSLRFDVSGEGDLTPLDVLRVINRVAELNADPSSARSTREPTDVNDDGATTVNDALMIINRLERVAAAGENVVREANRDFNSIASIDVNDDDDRHASIDAAIASLF